MSVNRYLPHVYLLPEDRANSELATGFGLGVTAPNAFRILEEAAGWHSVVEVFERDHIQGLRKYTHRFLVLLLDFDQDETRLETIRSRIPADLRDRVFVLGVWSEPENLKRLLGTSYEDIGKDLAETCLTEGTGNWNHELLQHNSSELERMRTHLRRILFL